MAAPADGSRVSDKARLALFLGAGLLLGLVGALFGLVVLIRRRWHAA